MRSSQTFVTPTVHQNKALETTKRALSGGVQHILQCNCCTERQRVHVSFHGLTPLPVTSVIISAGEPAHQLKQNLLAEGHAVYVSDLCGSRCPGGVRPSRGGSGHLGRFYRTAEGSSSICGATRFLVRVRQIPTTWKLRRSQGSEQGRRERAPLQKADSLTK